LAGWENLNIYFGVDVLNGLPVSVCGVCASSKLTLSIISPAGSDTSRSISYFRVAMSLYFAFAEAETKITIIISHDASNEKPFR
jgi:hypothetical protein